MSFSLSCHFIPFCRSPSKRYMQYFYQQFRLCHRDNYGESSIFWSILPLSYVSFVMLSVPQLAGPPVNVTCNIFINSFGSIAETTMVSWASTELGHPCLPPLLSALELRLNHAVHFPQSNISCPISKCTHMILIIQKSIGGSNSHILWRYTWTLY